jgi:hypothetical protein
MLRADRKTDVSPAAAAIRCHYQSGHPAPGVVVLADDAGNVPGGSGQRGGVHSPP